MKKRVVAALAALSCSQALACPLSQALAERYGISFSGFKTTIPAASAPDTTTGGPFVRMAIRDQSHVSDGFRHAVVMDTGSRKAWILRTGGFAGVYAWFGPVDAPAASLEHCESEPVLAAVSSLQGAWQVSASTVRR